MEIALLVISIVFLVFIGAEVFSLLLALSARMTKSGDSGRDLACETCGHVMKWYEMIPVISYIALRGRCRMCGDRIPLWDFLSEILGGAVFSVLFLRCGDGAFLKSHVHFADILYITAAADIYKAAGVLLAIGMSCLLFLAAATDIRAMLIPDIISILMFVLGIVSIFIYKDISLTEHLIGLVCVSLPMLVTTLVIPGAFGGGDIKLMAGIGLFLGWKLTLVAMFFAILTGGIYAIVLLANKKTDRKGHFAFGPFLCFGSALSMFCGYELLMLYLSFARRLYG